ncbi:SDR family oxidoreductase [Dietzia sp. PP-33]|jgi:NAD(P)-dependent dehydrogenase (short-subunit alcohol dehydrogenase family)|uniref:SDR family oxidoreductase n=1 Tax=Dietzia sp. PP-33 TaxID=2957500 RepID=UPI0029B344F7|nr:SDR family oxidoreductase [Dietzia sp. PP-33]MDX2356217.1 SDR family oxidoreductase [Dietzia sp. PP-33]
MSAAGSPVQRTVLITGAGRGIGEATARGFADAGYLVGAYDLQPCAWAEGDDRVVTGSLDVTDPAAWESALAELTARSGGALNVLVNNAGLLYGTPFMDASYERDSALVDVNVKGVMYGCRAAFPYLEKAVSPVVVNLCSASAIYGQAEMAVYSATKFAVRGITEALGLEWGPKGIRVCSVWPLYVGTGMLEGVSTAGMRNMGVNLTEGDVAGEILDLAEQTRRSPSGLLGRIRGLVGREVHRPVGQQATAMYLASQIGPGRVIRLVNQRLTS